MCPYLALITHTRTDGGLIISQNSAEGAIDGSAKLIWHHRLQSESEHQIYWKVIKSLYLQVVAIVSCLFVVVSTLCLIFSTLPAFQIKDEDGNISREFFTLVNTWG